MPVPPPFHDPYNIEHRLRLLAEILDTAVAEVRRVVQEIEQTTLPSRDGDNPGESND